MNTLENIKNIKHIKTLDDPKIHNAFTQIWLDSIAISTERRLKRNKEQEEALERLKNCRYKFRI